MFWLIASFLLGLSIGTILGAVALALAVASRLISR